MADSSAQRRKRPLDGPPPPDARFRGGPSHGRGWDSRADDGTRRPAKFGGPAPDSRFPVMSTSVGCGMRPPPPPPPPRRMGRGAVVTKPAWLIKRESDEVTSGGGCTDRDMSRSVPSNGKKSPPTSTPWSDHPPPLRQGTQDRGHQNRGHHRQGSHGKGYHGQGHHGPGSRSGEQRDQGSGWGESRGSNNNSPGQQGGGRDDTLNEFGHPYARISGPVNPNVCGMMEDEVHALIRERLNCRRMHNFRSADTVQRKLAACGIQINDSTNEWRADGLMLRGSPDMKNCQSTDEMIQTAFANLKKLSPRDLSAFWSVFSKFIQNYPGASAKRHQHHQEMTRRLNLILAKTMDTLDLFKSRDLSTVALCFGNIIKHVTECGKKIPKYSIRQTLQYIFMDRKDTMLQRLARCCLPSLHTFDERCLSNLASGYAHAECVPIFEDGRNLFDCITPCALEILASFTTRGVACLAWAFAKVQASNTELFARVADRILESDKISRFNPPELANLVWALGKAENSAGKPKSRSKGSIPLLLDVIADHMVALDAHRLSFFRLRDLSMILGAFASAHAELESDRLFEKLANVFVTMRDDELTPQEMSLILWAYASAGNLNKDIFSSFEPKVKSKLADCSCQDLAKIAWSYAVVDVPAPILFDGDFVLTCLKKESEFNKKDKVQLYQWHLWREELKSRIKLPLETYYKFHAVFVNEPSTASLFKNDILRELHTMGLGPQKEVPTPKGYFLDALVLIDGKDIGLELDGQYHFKGMKPTGKTILKRRQVTNLEGIALVSIPYWEWDKLALSKDHGRKQAYLRSCLGIGGSNREVNVDEKVNEKVKVEPKTEDEQNIKIEE